MPHLGPVLHIVVAGLMGYCLAAMPASGRLRVAGFLIGMAAIANLWVAIRLI